MERLSMGMNCKRCGCYIGEYSKRGRPRQYCESCLPVDDRPRLKEDVGTTDISSKMSRDKNGKPDFKKEKNVVKKELRKLGLHK